MAYLLAPGLGTDTHWMWLAILFMAYIVIRGLIFQGSLLLWVQKSAFAIRRRVFQIPFGKGQPKSELVASISTVMIDGIFFALLAKYGPTLHPTQNFVLSLVLSLAWLEVWFYFSHRLLHTRALYFLHKQHHVARVASPLTALSFSMAERLILISGGMGMLAAISLLIPLSSMGIALSFFVNYVLNLFGHMNIEVVPPRFLKSPLGRFLNSPTYHSLHHARYNGHYGLFTPYLDQWFSTRFDDYELVHERAYHEQGLTQLGERISREATI